MKFLIRVDDFGWTDLQGESAPHKIADRGLVMAQRFHDTMRGLPYVAAVIPSTTDHDGLAWLQSAPVGMTIAMHGLNHSLSADRVASEFRDMDQKRIRQRIAWGRLALKDLPISDMVLPFNRYEPELSESCYLEKIVRIWGGGLHSSSAPSHWPTPPQPYPLGRTTFIPTWAPTYGATTREFGESPALDEVLPKLISRAGKAVICLHLPWEASLSNTFDGVKWLVDMVGDRVISLDEFLK